MIDKALDAALERIQKQFGKGSVMLMSDEVREDVASISTGSIALDEALGIGGVPKGRVIEIYGPESSGKTTLALHIIANAQKDGGRAAFIDAEHALDAEYAAALGVDTDSMVISQPDNGEQALEITDQLVSAGVVDIIVIDSVAALTPKAEIEGDMGDSHMGLQARLMSQALRKLTGTVKKNNVLVIFINQLRMKIGVTWGCFHYNARVVLADGTTEKIGKIVNQKKDVEVLSYNKITGLIEPKKITGWFRNGIANKMHQMVVRNPHGNGRSNLPIGDDHVIATPDGDRLFSELTVGDNVYVRSNSYLNDDQYQIALGMELGDSSLRCKNYITSSLRTKHGRAQADYCQWKMGLFPKEFIGSSGFDKNDQFWFESKPTAELSDLRHIKSGGAIRHIPQDIVERIDLLSLAIWYLDDGNFSGTYQRWGWGKSRIAAMKMDDDSMTRVAERMVDLGLPYPSIDNQGFIFYGKKSRLFQEKIADIVPACMEYKIHPKLRGTYRAFDATNQYRESIAVSDITDIYDKPPTRGNYKFDIGVEGNHNYFVDDVLVHNSPETTCGGNALKFYASVRLDIRRIGAIKNGDEIVGNQTKVKVVKNKMAPPFKIALFEILYGQGISKVGEILDYGIERGLIIQQGSWFSLPGDTRLGQGREKARQWLIDNPDVADEIEKEIRGG